MVLNAVWIGHIVVLMVYIALCCVTDVLASLRLSGCVQHTPLVTTTDPDRYHCTTFLLSLLTSAVIEYLDTLLVVMLVYIQYRVTSGHENLEK